MRKIAFRLSAILVVLVISYSGYYAYAQAKHVKYVTRALSSCSARTAIVLTHANHDFDSLSRAIRNVSEAITYIDGVVNDVHIHSDGSVHFDDEQTFAYMKLCGDTLRTEKSFLEAVGELGSLSAAQPVRQGGGKALADAQLGASVRSERAFDELLARHKLLREALTEIRNENAAISSEFPPGALVDIGAIEHAQRELDLFLTKTKS